MNGAAWAAMLVDAYEEFDKYVPRGPCANGCGRPATERHEVYKGSNRLEFWCRICDLTARLDWARKRVVRLEAELAEANAVTFKGDGGGGFTPRPNAASDAGRPPCNSPAGCSPGTVGPVQIVK